MLAGHWARAACLTPFMICGHQHEASAGPAPLTCPLLDQVRLWLPQSLAKDCRPVGAHCVSPRGRMDGGWTGWWVMDEKPVECRGGWGTEPPTSPDSWASSTCQAGTEGDIPPGMTREEGHMEASPRRPALMPHVGGGSWPLPHHRTERGGFHPAHSQGHGCTPFPGAEARLACPSRPPVGPGTQ